MSKEFIKDPIYYRYLQYAALADNFPDRCVGLLFEDVMLYDIGDCPSILSCRNPIVRKPVHRKFISSDGSPVPTMRCRDWILVMNDCVFEGLLPWSKLEKGMCINARIDNPIEVKDLFSCEAPKWLRIE